MRKLFLPLVLAALFHPAFHSARADDAADRAAFEKAYQKYQSLINSDQAIRALGPAHDAYEYGRKVFGPDSKNTAALALNYGRLASGEEAIRVLTEALTIYEALYGPDSERLIDPLMELAAASMGFVNTDSGYKYYIRALKLAENHDGADSMAAGKIRLDMGRAALTRAKSRSALGYLKRAERTFKSLKGPEAEAALAEANFWLGKLYLGTDNLAAATASLLEAADTFDKIGPSSQMTLTTHAFLVRAYEERGMREEATKHCQLIGAAGAADPNQDFLPVYYVQPKYPHDAQVHGHEGSVVLSVTVDPNGFVKDPKVLSVKGDSSFQDAALQAITKFRYAPRFKNGHAIETHDVKYRFNFVIDRTHYRLRGYRE